MLEYCIPGGPSLTSCLYIFPGTIFLSHLWALQSPASSLQMFVYYGCQYGPASPQQCRVTSSIHSDFDGQCLALSRPSLDTYTNHWLTFFFSTNTLSGTEEILDKGIWKEPTRWHLFAGMNLPHWGDPWLSGKGSKTAGGWIKFVASGKVRSHQNSSSVVRFRFLARDADPFSENVDWLHSCAPLHLQTFIISFPSPRSVCI